METCKDVPVVVAEPTSVVPPVSWTPILVAVGLTSPSSPGGGVVSFRRFMPLDGIPGMPSARYQRYPWVFFVPHAGAVPVGSGCVVVALCDPPTLRIGEVPPSMVAHTPRSPPEGGGGRDFARV